MSNTEAIQSRKPISKTIGQTAIRSELFKVNDEKLLVDLPGPETSQSNSYLQKFVGSILDQRKNYPLPDPVVGLVQNGQTLPLLTLKSYSLWQGKQKSKKTTALALAVAAFIRDKKNDDDIQFVGCQNGVVLFFDNEQGESYAARTMNLILKLADVETTEKLIYCDLREFSPKERMEIIKAGIDSNPGVRLVVIDGLVDLLTDFMDASEGHLATSDILKLCSQYNIHVAGVLHQNKNDKNARAHIGTISSQKCEVEISTEVDPNDRNQSQVVCVNSRGLPFETFAIRWDKGSLPCINQEWNSDKAGHIKVSKNYERSMEIAEAVFKPLAALRPSEAIKALMIATSKSESTVKRLINDFKGWDLIEQGYDGLYRIKNKIGSRVQEGSKEGS